jgi:hypothetical protein
VAENFPQECRHVLETLGSVYHNDALTRQRELSPEGRLLFHREHSAPVMKELHEWMKAQFAEHKVEPNSGLGKAISYLLNHWTKLTLFLSQAGAPLDNNIVTAARGSDDVMPRARLCRAEVAKGSLTKDLDFSGSVCRHNYRLSKKASNGSGGRKRSGARPDEVAWASARSLSRMSACK